MDPDLPGAADPDTGSGASVSLGALSLTLTHSSLESSIQIHCNINNIISLEEGDHSLVLLTSQINVLT